MTQISRQEYAGLFGPTVGDKIRLGDTDLYIEIEQDLREDAPRRDGREQPAH